MHKQVNLGIIGAGAVSRSMHIPALLKLSNKYKVSALCDKDPASLLKAKKEFNFNENTRLTANAEDIFQNPAIDAVAVLTPTESHIPYTIKSLKSGKYVFLEKPAAVNLKGIVQLKKAVAKSKCFIQVGMVLRYSSFYRKLLALISSGRYGRLLWMNWLETRPFDPKLWRYSDPAGNGDAIIHDKAVHQVNLFNAFAGSNPKTISAMGGQYLLSSKKFNRVKAFENEVMLKGSSNDNLMALIGYKNGVKASLTVSYVSPYARESRWIIQLEKAKIAAHFETFTSAGKTGRRKWKGAPSSIYLFTDNFKYPVPWKYPASYPPSEKNLVFYDEYPDEPIHPGSKAQWEEFYTSIIKRKKPACSIDLAYKDTEITDAIVRSIKYNKTISLK